MSIESEYEFIDCTEEEELGEEKSTYSIWGYLDRFYTSVLMFVISTVIYFYIWYHFGSEF